MHTTPSGNLHTPHPWKASRRIKMGVKQHFTGSLVIDGEEGRGMEIESHTELQTALVMLARRDVANLENQVPFAWIDETGAPRWHYFNFRVSLRDGTQTALIVKNAKAASKESFRAEMRSMASQVTPDVADRVTLFTENNLDPIEVHNAELVHAVRSLDPEPDAAVRRVVAGLAGTVRIADVVDAAGCSGRGFRATALLIWSHELELVRHERIAPDAFVRRRIN